MSTAKINVLGVIGVVLSAFTAAAGVIYLAGAKANDIDTQKEQIRDLRGEVKVLNASASAIDERTRTMMEIQRTMQVELRNMAADLRVGGGE